MHWPVKRDGSDIGADTTVYFSSLSHFRPSLPVTATVRVDSAGGLVSVALVNLRVVDMLRQVFNCTSLPPSHVLLKVPDSSLFVYDASRDYMDQFDAKARYCYRAVLPLAGWQNKVLADLGFYLHIKASYSYTNTKVLLTNASGDRLYDLNKNYTGRPVLLDKNFPDTLLHPALRKTWMLTIQDYSTKTTVE
ncbi:MAG TPA: hypothetical protein VG738_19155 [Chitinophagaceae bacterium]|nr:hypothetical protein [Chitinophagaceae bacterium]